MNASLSFQLSIIDFYTTFQYLLQYRSSDYIELNPDSYIPDTTVFCPFHENKETKAAKLYGKNKEDQNQSEKLYCFAENKLYFPHSLLSPPKNVVDKSVLFQFKSIIPYDPNWVFSAIWNHLPDTEKDYWKQTNPSLSIGEPVKKYGGLYREYKEGKRDLFSILKELS